MRKKSFLLINPWIYDFAAYDLWMKPWGLLKISTILKKHGLDVFFVDALDRHHPAIDEAVKDKPDGTGKFISKEIDKPSVFKEIPRKFKRYGLPVEKFTSSLPDKDIELILVTSVMTYWYPGVFDSIKILREKYSDPRIILGGSYATLCPEHARDLSGADMIIGNKEISRLSDAIGEDIDFSFEKILDEDIDYSWYRKGSVYGVLRVSLGCPFDCSYCAQKKLNPGYILKDIDKALGEIKYLFGRGIRNFAFYDDALLFDRDYIEAYLRALLDMKIIANLFTPNGLHAKFLSGNIADLMKKTGFVNPILSLETVTNDSLWHNKVTQEDFAKAVENLKRAGYGSGEYTAYILLGAPGSSLNEVEKAVDFAHSMGALVSLSEYSPVPGTEMAEGISDDIINEPLLHNNSAFPNIGLSDWGELNQLKNSVRAGNRMLTM